MKKVINIRFQNGLTFENFKKDVFDCNEVSGSFDFVESNEPDYIVFGPYGNDIPPKGNYIRIGYYCENVIPDLTNCDWAFGIPKEEEINNSKYKRIQWHGLNPNSLVKDENDTDRLISNKTKFCNFIYSNPVPYREFFFEQLSRYKKIDAPGKSMNNMPSVDSFYSGDVWERKRKFLSEYKFTIAFENYCYPGYQTEKLYDPMLAGSIPIYCGDSSIGDVFNTNSFVNVPDYLNIENSGAIKLLEKLSRPNFTDMLPRYYRSPKHHIMRKLKLWGRQFKMHRQFNKADYSGLIERIIEIDKDPLLYEKYIKEPWLKHNTISEQFSNKVRWTEIFENN